MGMISDFGGNRSSKCWNQQGLSEMKCCEAHAAAELGQIVLIGATDFPDEAVQPEAPEKVRDLRAGLVGEDMTQAAAGQPADVELPAQQGDEQFEIIAVEQVEPADGTISLAHGSGDCVQVCGAAGGIVEGRDKLEVAPVGRPLISDN